MVKHASFLSFQNALSADRFLVYFALICLLSYFGGSTTCVGGDWQSVAATTICSFATLV
eukprot:SAG31_NODE_29921_length_388_cov_0.716263_1_plen_58_part_10